MARTRGPSVKLNLLQKSREAALNAVQAFNNPLTTFKTETFIVLMVIAWTYLLHAYFRSQGVEYRYHEQGPMRRKFKRTKNGAFIYWDLSRCLNENSCPLDKPTKSNLRFLIGLRNEIEHHQSAGVDEALTGKYVACCLNYEREISQLFGSQYSVAPHMSYALQLRALTSPAKSEEDVDLLPTNVAEYIAQFDAKLPLEEYQHPHFSYRLLFVPKLAKTPSQTDRVIEFIAPDSELAKEIDRQYWVQKETEKPKYRPSDIVKLMNEEGYPQFKMHHHTELWQGLDARKPGKGYGVDVSGTWYWYDRWVERAREHCVKHREEYGPKE